MGSTSHGVANLFHLPPVMFELVTAFGHDMRSRDGPVFPRCFFDTNQRRFFEPGQLHRQIAPGQTCRGFKESEVGALTTREHGEDGEPGGFVHQTIQIRKGARQGGALAVVRQWRWRKDAEGLSRSALLRP
jgi:hypothetical protein